MDPARSTSPAGEHHARTAAVRAALEARLEPLLRARITSTLRYLMTTEVHTYAFSVAANAILSFFPFMVLLMTLIRHVLHSPAMYQVVVQLLQDHLPTGQEFVIRNLNVMVDARRGVQVISLFILLITANGVFLPLEVALNKVWGFPRNRSYLRNQVVSFLLAFGCGLLAMLSIGLTAAHHSALHYLFGGPHHLVSRFAAYAVMKTFAVAAGIGIFFLIYWVLPNGHISWRRVLPVAVAMGLLWEGAMYLYILALPWLDFREVYGPFAISVTLIFWAFLSGMLLLAGAHLSADPPRLTLEPGAR